ncbi:MAG: adenylyl-sulfate kinase [Paracoccaceae bacterium]|jgi:adenylyl-sulfate kinase
MVPPATASAQRSARRGSSDKGCVLWFTGLSGAGKSTLAARLSAMIAEREQFVEVLDGDMVRQHLSQRLGFTKDDRDMNVRRIGFVANLLSRNGCCALTATISPYRSVRAEIRAMIDPERSEFVEVYVNAPLSVVEERDTKGLYKKARAGLIKNFTGVSDPYEAPEDPEIVVHTGDETVEESAGKILRFLEERGLVAALAND